MCIEFRGAYADLMFQLLAFFAPLLFSDGNVTKLRSLPDLLQCRDIGETDSDNSGARCWTDVLRKCQHVFL